MKGILIYFILVISIFSRNISQIAYGKTEEKAKQNALAFLSQSISVDVKSSFFDKEIVIDGKFLEEKEKNIYLKSNLPLLGVLFNISTLEDEFMVEAVLTNESLEVYELELKRLKGEIDSLKKLYKESKNKSNVLKEIIKNTENYNRYLLVYSFISDTYDYSDFLEVNSFKIQLKDLENRFSLLEEAISTTFKEMYDYNNIYVYPPSMVNSEIISPFGKVVQKSIENSLDERVSTTDTANFFLRGTYEVFDDIMLLDYKLYNNQGKIKETYAFILEKEAFETYDIEVHNSFDKLLRDGYIVSNDFFIDIQSQRGKKDLLFTSEDSVELIIKSNRSCYFYLLGHTFLNDAEYTYLVDFNESIDNRKFVFYIGPDDINKWISLGEFVIMEPYGVEALQVFASTNDIIDSIPQNYYDYSLELYLLGENPSKNLEEVRAIAKKKRKNVEVTESYLLFRTIEK